MTTDHASGPRYAFSLTPFEPCPALRIDGTVHRRPGTLTVEFLMRGAIGDLVLPSSDAAPRRRHELWRTTCFELFAALPGATAYWELNAAPGGDWNLYAFDEYRQGMREEPRVAAPRSRCSLDADEFRFALTLDPDPLAGGKDLEIGLCAVTEHRDHRINHWALTHPATRADFHDRRGFARRFAPG